MGTILASGLFVLSALVLGCGAAADAAPCVPNAFLAGQAGRAPAMDWGRGPAAKGTGPAVERGGEPGVKAALRGPDLALLVDLPDIASRARRSVVSVIAGRAGDGPAFSEHTGPAREHALGSGFLIAADGLVLTSRHVIDGADDVRVDLDDGRSFPGAIVARDAVLDVALIRLAGAKGLPVSDLGSSAALQVGDPVVAIGNPFGLGPSVTLGILSARARAIDDGPPGEFLQSDAAVNPGNSGGPLLDAEGRVVGINTAVVDHGQGISFAVPIDDVRLVLRELTATGRVARGHAGISFQAVDVELARALGLPAPTGALVTDVDAPSPAARAGVRAGDLITAADGKAIEHAEDLARMLAQQKPGDVLRLSVRRGACTRSVSILLERLPNPDGDAEARVSPGVRVRGLSGLRLSDAEGGARVDGIDPASPAADGLHVGDVLVEIDRSPVHSAAEATRRLALARHRPHATGEHHTALLRLRREHSSVYVGVDLD